MKATSLAWPRRPGTLVTLFSLIIAVNALAVACIDLDHTGGSATGNSPQAAAGSRNGLPPNPAGLLRWDDLPVHYCIDFSSAGYLSDGLFATLVDKAFAAWGVPSVDDSSCSGPVTEADGTNEIGWGTPPGRPEGHGRVFEAGVTNIRSSECVTECDPNDRVQISEADIIIDNNPPREFRTQACLFSTLLHEVGHFLGLDHLPAPAVMAPQTSSCPQQLTAADRDALNERYGTVKAS